MSTDFVLNAQSRSDLGKGASRRLRREGKFPAVIYGTGADPQSLTMDHDPVLHNLENEAFYSSILTIKIDGKDVQAVVKDIQRHAYKPKLLHMDFLRVSATEKLTMQVPLHFLGEEDAPGVKAGGVVTHNISELEVSCLAKDLPEFIEVDLSDLDMDGIRHISEIKLPAGVESTALAHDNDLPVAAIHKTRASVESSDEGGEAASDEGEKPADE